MNNTHRSRIANTRYAVNKGSAEFSYKVCMCDYGIDHDDFRSITGQDKEVRFGTNDMLKVAKRHVWNFPPKDLDYLENWLQTGGPFVDGKLTPVPFADEISDLVRPKGEKEQ